MVWGGGGQEGELKYLERERNLLSLKIKRLLMFSPGTRAHILGVGPTPFYCFTP